ncbi:MAG: subclass B3 metallo-beta-lactamase [Acidobacteria bacterium]|nr:subclass B3 metallo-beta-lactamase [Acidobacteriota bacterium]
MVAATLSTSVHIQDDPLVRPYGADRCASCTEWNAPQRPVHLFGNTYYVGTRGLASVLIASPEGHVILDGGLPDSAPLILANIKALGFDPAHVTLILNSHAHFDHAGGIAALQRASGARVAASPASARVLKSGTALPEEPQHGLLFDMPPVPAIEGLTDGQTLRVGRLALTAHFTGGHSPGGTSWSWESCEGDRCLAFVYADSLTPVSADEYQFSRNPSVVADFERSYAVLERASCDVLLTPHPAASALWERVASRPDGLVDGEACRRYAATGRRQLEERLAREGR